MVLLRLSWVNSSMSASIFENSIIRLFRVESALDCCPAGHIGRPQREGTGLPEAEAVEVYQVLPQALAGRSEGFDNRRLRQATSVEAEGALDAADAEQFDDNVAALLDHHPLVAQHVIDRARRSAERLWADCPWHSRMGEHCLGLTVSYNINLCLHI